MILNRLKLFLWLHNLILQDLLYMSGYFLHRPERDSIDIHATTLKYVSVFQYNNNYCFDLKMLVYVFFKILKHSYRVPNLQQMYLRPILKKVCGINFSKDQCFPRYLYQKIHTLAHIKKCQSTVRKHYYNFSFSVTSEEECN